MGLFRKNGEVKEKKAKRVEATPSKVKPYEVTVSKGRQVMIVPEQLEDHEAFSDRIFEMVMKRRGF